MWVEFENRAKKPFAIIFLEKITLKKILTKKKSSTIVLKKGEFFNFDLKGKVGNALHFKIDENGKPKVIVGTRGKDF